MTDEHRQIFKEVYKLYEKYEHPPAPTEHPEDRVHFFDAFYDACREYAYFNAHKPLAINLIQAIMMTVMSAWEKGGD